jgi:APA family basic amino acid/polyamine antiporter
MIHVGRETGVPPAGREMGFAMAVALVMGNMIGSGIFLLPASLAPFGGASLPGWCLSTAGAVMIALVFARLARLDPAAGGLYAYTRHGFGDLAGFLVGWGYWISIWCTLAAISVAFVGYLDPFIPSIVRNPAAAGMLAVGTVWVLIGVNIAGVRAAGWVQVVTTVLKLAPLIVIGAIGLAAFEPSRFAIAQTDARSLAGSVNAAATLTLWAFLGLECATIPAASIRDPSRTIPRATVVGTLVTSVVYIASTVGVMSLVPAEVLATSTAPFADAARAVGGNWAGAAIALGAAISCFGALNGWTLVAGQLPLAVARDGLFPAVFGRVSSNGTPSAGILVAGLLTTVLVAMNYTRNLVDLFTFIILLATLNTLIPYTFCSLAGFLISTKTEPALRVRTGAGLIASLAFTYSLWTIAGAGTEVVYWGFLLIAAGLPVYVWVTRRRAHILA